MTEHRRSTSGSGHLAVPHANRVDPTPPLKAGVNPLYGSEIVGTLGTMEIVSSTTTPSNGTHAQHDGGGTTSSSSGGGGGSRPAKARRAQASSQRSARPPNTRGGSPQSTLTTSTSQSSTSSRHQTRPSVATGSSSTGGGTRGKKVAARSKNAVKAMKGEGPAPLVPALLAPVPPPPPKRKSRSVSEGRGRGDIEAGHAPEGSVMEDAPDKTLMEMLQTYLKKQDLYTRIVLVVVLLLLAGGVLGAYVVMVFYAIRERSVKYIVLVSVFSGIFLWVFWKYCLTGDATLQDQSAIAQDIATLYAAIPDHTAVRGVSEKGRAQFTAFKYEKSEMMFTAVTDDGVSLGSERGSELMLDGADPACPLCNVAYVEGADLCLLPCLHVFHKSCINKWCNRHIVCPLCKRHLEAPEPLHTLTAAANGTIMAQSEPGGHHGVHGQARGTWRHMLGASAPGPASGHGSERGLGGTRSEDGLWNDRVLNAAQRQQGGRGHNRVTSFSSETRRANSSRGRSGPGSGGRGPPKSGSAGTSVGRGAQRSHSINVTSGRHPPRVQRQRSSSFTTASERGRGGSGRVAHGTAPQRGAGGSRHGDLSTSPRSRSDLGLGSKDADGLRATSDAILSRHASRQNMGAGGTKALSKQMFGEDGAGAWAGDGKGGDTKRKVAVVTVSSKKSSLKGVHSKGQGPAVITVRKVRQTPNSTPGRVGGARRPRRASEGSVRDVARSGGESESDAGMGIGERVFHTNGSSSTIGGERVFMTNSSRHNDYYDEDSNDDAVTTKALTYGPRKPRPSSKSKEGPGHRRQSSTGSTSAKESGAEESRGSAKKSRRRPSIPGSRSGSGNHTATATAAATAEAVSKLLGRPQKRETRKSATASQLPGKRATAAAGSNTVAVTRTPEPSGETSGGESGSDGRTDRTRRNSRSSSGGAGVRTAHRRNTHPPQQKTTPPKSGPVTKGTPAPPMAAARVATWNNNSTAVPAAPVIDASGSSEADLMQPEETHSAAVAEGRGGRGGGVSTSPTSGGAVGDKRGSGNRGWRMRIPSSTGSAEFYGYASNTIISGGDAGQGGGNGLANSMLADREVDARGSASGGSGSLASKVFMRASGGSGNIVQSAARLFGSGPTAARIGMAPAGGAMSDSEGDRTNASRSAETSAGKVDMMTSSSVQELIQTYEKSRSSSDERAQSADERGLSAHFSDAGPSRRNSMTFTRRKGSTASVGSVSDFAATESELDDDDHINRPKLSYKKKSARHGRTRTPPDAAGVANTLVRGRSRSNVEEGTIEAPVVNPDGDDWGDEEPYSRPKLSYGGGLLSASSRKSSFAFDSVPGVPTASR